MRPFCKAEKLKKRQVGGILAAITDKLSAVSYDQTFSVPVTVATSKVKLAPLSFSAVASN